MIAAVALLLLAVQNSAPAAPLTTPAAVQLSLEEAIRNALENDLSLEIEEATGEVTRYVYESSWGTFDPLLRAGLDYGHSESERQSGLPPPLPPVFQIDSESWTASTGINFPLLSGGAFDLSLTQTTSDTTFSNPSPSIFDSLGVSFAHPLIRGAGTRYRTSIPRENELRHHLQLERIRQARQDLIRNVIDAYWNLVAALEQLKVADETLALGREQLDQNQRRLAAGVGTEVEVLQADTNVAQRIEQKLARELAVKAAADRLKGLMYPGTQRETWELELQPVTDLPVVEPEQVPDWNSALVAALAHRPELRQQLFQIDVNEEGLLRARSERGPALDFVVSGESGALEGSEGQAFESAVSWDFPAYAASLRFSFPIGNRAALYAEKAARALVRSARLVYDQIE
jgi:outer membrane protein